MPLPAFLNVALKEWAIVCGALETGRQMLLLRKGGIYEAAGEFEVEHRQFLFFPAYLHQKPAMVKPADRANVSLREIPPLAEPPQIQIQIAGVVTDIIELTRRQVMDALDDQHIWNPSLIDMRFNYRPENPLYLLLIRAYRLPQSVPIENTPDYIGCKSWITLDAAIATAGARPVLHDEDYEVRRQEIKRRLDEAAC